MSFNMKDNQSIKKSNGHNCCNILSKQKPMSLQQCSENGWMRKILYRKMPAAQHRSDERITTSPFCNSSVIADSRRGQRKHKTWLKSCWEIALWQKSPHKFSLTAKEKYPCTRERSGSHQLCISSTETAGYYATWNSQRNLWCSWGKNVCYCLNVCVPPKFTGWNPTPRY